MKTIQRYVDKLKQNKILVILLLGCYLASIIFGVMLPNFNEKDFFRQNAFQIFYQSLTVGGKISSLILNRLFSDIFCLLVIYVLSVSVLFLPINFFLIIYRGYVQGAVMAGLVCCFGITGIMLYIFVVFLQSAVSTFALILMTVCTYDLHKEKCKRNVKFFDYLTGDVIICFLIIILSLVSQVLLLLLFLKPMNYVF